MSRLVEVHKQLNIPDEDIAGVDALAMEEDNKGRPWMAALLRRYAFLLRQLPVKRPLSTSDEFNHPELKQAPLQSVEARYQDLLAHLGVLGHDGAIAEINSLRRNARLDEPKNTVASQEKVRSDVTMKTERVDVYVARLEGELNQAAFSHKPFGHPNVEEAQKEAFRLAKKEPGLKFGVFTCRGLYQIPPQEPVWTYAHCKKED